MAIVKVNDTQTGKFDIYSITQFNQIKGMLPEHFTYEIMGQKKRG